MLDNEFQPGDLVKVLYCTSVYDNYCLNTVRSLAQNAIVMVVSQSNRYCRRYQHGQFGFNMTFIVTPRGQPGMVPTFLLQKV